MSKTNDYNQPNYSKEKQIINELINNISVKKEEEEKLSPFSIVTNKKRFDYLYGKLGKPLVERYNLNSISELDKKINQILEVFYIRENLTVYDTDVFEGDGNTKNNNLAAEYRKAVFDKIAEAYPDLKEECEDQLNIINKIKSGENDIFEIFWKVLL